MGDLARYPELPWFTAEVQAGLVACVATGLKPSWIARRCGVHPKALGHILELGGRKDAVEPYRSFVRRWVDAEAALMEEKTMAWRDGSSTAWQFLQQRWPSVWGKDAAPDYEAISPAASNADELEQLDAIIRDPAAYGPDVYEMFRKHGRLKAGEE